MKKELGLATKTDVRKLGAEVKREIAELRREIATRKELAELRRDMVTRKVMDFSISWAIQQSEERTDERARKYRDEILTAVSEVMGELKTMREEHAALSARVYENHEERITKLEEIVYPASKTSPVVS